MDNSEVKKLYDALIRKGYTERDLGDAEVFARRISDEKHRKQFYDYVVKRGDFRIGDYDTYERRLTGGAKKTDNGGAATTTAAPAATTPTAPTTTTTPTAAAEPTLPEPKQPEAAAPGVLDKPLTEQDKIRLSVGLNNMNKRHEATMGALKGNLDNMTEWAENVKVGTKVDVAEGKPMFNPETKSMDKTYLSPLARRYFDGMQAYMDASQFREAIDMTTAGRLRRAQRELRELQRKMVERRQQVYEDNKPDSNGGWSFFLERDPYSNEYTNDEQIRMLEVAITEKEKTIGELEDQVRRDRGEDPGLWHQAGRVASDPEVFTFGLAGTRKWSTIKNSAPDDESTPEEDAAYQDMLSAINENEQTAAEFAENWSNWERWGQIFGHVPFFGAELFLTGGGFKGIKFLTKMGTKLGAKAIGKEAAEEITKQGVIKYIKSNGWKGIGNVALNGTIKSFGVAADELLFRAPLVVNTIHMPQTITDVYERKYGDIVENEDGKLEFANDKSWSTAIWESEADNTIEVYSEMFGEHLDGVMSIKGWQKASELFGLKRLSGVLAKAEAGELGTIINTTRKWLGKAGVNSYLGEVGEEYYGQLLRTGVNLDEAYKYNEDGTRTNLFFDDQWQSDIWGGMLITQGLLMLPGHAISAGRYTYMRHRVNRADATASELIGAETWGALRQIIDNTSNDAMGEMAVSIMNDASMTQESRDAAIAYIGESLRMRGFNLGTMAQGRNGTPDGDAQSLNESYIDGYNAVSDQERNDANNMYNRQRERVSEFLDEDALNSLDEDVANGLAMLRGSELTEEQRGAVLEYLNAKQVRDGMMQRVRDDINGRIDQSNAMINARTNRDTRMIHPATMKQGDRKVYVVSGNLVQYDDKSGIDNSASDESVIVRDAETGNLEQVSPDAILNIDEPIDPLQEKIAAAEQIRQQMAQQAANEIDGVITFNAGDTYEIPGAMQGQTISLSIVANEEGIVDNGDGTVNVSMGGRTFPMAKEALQAQVNAVKMQRIYEFERQRAESNLQQQQQSTSQPETPAPQEPIKFNRDDEVTLRDAEGNAVQGRIITDEEDGHYQVETDTPLNGRTISNLTADEISGILIERNGEAVAQPEAAPETPQQVTPETPQQLRSTPQGETATPAPQQQQVQSAFERVPKDAEGNPMYEQTDSDTAWDAIVEQTEGDEAMAQTVAESMVADKEAELKKVQKAKPKAGTTIAEKIAAEKEQKAAVAAAQQSVDAWKKIAGTVSRRKSAAEAEKARAAAEAEKARRAEEERLRAEREEAARIEREKLNGVPDMTEDKPADARKRGYRRVNGHIVERQQPVGGLRGKEIEVKFSDKEMPKGRVAVIESEQLQPSHLQGQRNPLHFIDEAQPKERKDAASIASSRKIAGNIRPEEITSSVTAYTGAPTVNARGEVIQGNNRSDALRLMWETQPEQAAKYKQYLIEHAEEFGLNPEEIAAMKHPVLVGMLDVKDEDAIRLGQYVAQDTESGGIERIKPKNAVQKMGNDMRTFANLLLKSADDDMSISALIDANGVDVLKWMNEKGYITPTQYSSAFDSRGNLTDEAKNDLRGIMYQSIFQGASTSLEEMFYKLPIKAQRAILATLYRDFDSPVSERMTKEVQSSVMAYYALQQYPDFIKAKTQEETMYAIESWKRQYQMDDATGESYVPAKKFSNFALHLAMMYKVCSQNTIQGTFNKMFDLIQGTQEATLFETPDNTPRTLAQAIKETLNIDYNGQNGSNLLAGDNTTSQRGEQGSPRDTKSGESDKGGERSTDNRGRADGIGEQVERPEKGGERSAESGEAAAKKETPQQPRVEKPKGGGEKAPLSGEEADALLSKMKAKATVAPFVEITEDTWNTQYETPVGIVKMGEGQKDKLFEMGRADQYGMLIETLTKPDIILEEYDKEPNLLHNRASTYLFVKTFLKEDGSKYVHFESVTVSQDGMEVSISSHIIRERQLMGKMKSDRLLYKATALDKSANSSAEQPINGGSHSSSDKGTKNTQTDNKKEQNNATNAEKQTTEQQDSKPKEELKYSVEPAKYTTKKGKVLDMHLVKFPFEMRDGVKKLASSYAKQLKGWWDAKQGGFLMRSAEDAKALGDYVVDVQSRPHISLSDIKSVNNGELSFTEAKENTGGDTNSPKWQYSMTVDKATGETIIYRDDVSGVIPIRDGRFKISANTPEEMLEILSNPANNMQDVLGEFSSTLKNWAKVRKLQQEQNDNGNDGGGEQTVVDKPKTNPSGNRLVTDERYAELRARMRKKLLGQMNSGYDPEILTIGIEMALYHLEKGARKFTDYAKAMIEDLGDAIRPYLKACYNGARDLPEVESSGMVNDMTSYEEVRGIDIANFDKPHFDAMATAETVSREAEVETEVEIAKQRIKKSTNVDAKNDKKSVNSQQQTGGLPAKSSTNAERELHRRFANAVKDDMLSAFDAGTKPYRSIVDIRKRARELGIEVDEEGRTDILLQELVEDGLVRAARELVAIGGLTNKESYEAICKLYEMQPTIAARSSNRIKMQQYSTPLPMAWIADRFAMEGNEGARVLEPTAGNGMLVIGVPSAQVHANELDETRLANLREQGFGEVIQQDATEPFKGGQQYDAVIANPPFGTREAKDYDGKMIPGLDPQIALNALASMKDSGRAAIIIGGNMEYADNGAIKNMKTFFTYLYDHYNVKGVIDMSGKLYSKQGTSYPTRMILIEGRRSEEERAQTTVYPPVQSKAIRTAETFDDLYEIINEIINSKQKTNGTEVLRSGEWRHVSVSNNTPGQTNRVRHQKQSETDDDTPSGTRRGGGTDMGGRVGRSESPVLRQRGQNDTTGETWRQPRAAGESGAVGGGLGQRTVVDGNRPVAGLEVQRGGVGLKEKPKRDLTEEKLPYIPHNTAFKLESVAPAAMVEAMDRVLSQIEEEHGSIDEFIKNELGYENIEEAHRALAAEQMDSVAMAIYQMEHEQALIIGDQTGVGKGRQMAALIRWAVKKGKKPIFITQKADLFSDIYRDLVDIGSGDLKPFIFNSASGKENRGEMVDANGNVVYKALSDAKMKKVLESGVLPDEFDFAVLTYSQVNTGDEQSRAEAENAAKKSGKRVKKKKEGEARTSPKAVFLRKIAKDNYMFLDESHTAAGESNTGAYLQSLLRNAKAATFASATFAKRPDTMPLYAVRTAMSKAKVEPERLISVIEKGGVTLQEIMSRELTNAGQMVRRERDMTGVVTDWKTISDEETTRRARENYDRTIEAFNAIIQFQEMCVKPVIEAISEKIAIAASSAGVKRGTNKMGIENVPFASKTYNYTKQLMLALKTDSIVDEIEAEIKAGRHPVIALENTMESNIKDYNDGEVIDEPTFSASLLRGLYSVMQYTEKDENGIETHYTLTPRDLGPIGEEEFYKLVEFIRKSTADIYISPIDDIIDKLHERGYRVGEMTGRNNYVERTDDGKCVVRRRADKDKKKMQRDFNSGALDVLILNKSASTGISLHASEKFSDQRQRSMIIAQPLSDINDYMQMIGRIDRTGQVHRGYYINLGLPVPAENRFLMMLSTKLKSLNANTTTSQDSESNEVEAPDLLNKYGSQVIVEYLRDNIDIYKKLGSPFNSKKDFENNVDDAEVLSAYQPQEDDARKVTGLVALLSTSEQEDFYQDVVKRYNDLIKYLDETGTNDLKITVMPLRAQTIGKKISSQGMDPNGSNPFAHNSYVEKVEMDVLRKPMKANEIRKAISQINKGMEPKDYMAQLIGVIKSEYEAKIAAENARYDKSKSRAEADIEKQKEKINSQTKRSDDEKREAISSYITDKNSAIESKHESNLSRIEDDTRKLVRLLRAFEVGKSYLVPDNLEVGTFDFSAPAIFLGFKANESKITASTTLAVFATLDGRRRIEVKLSKGNVLANIMKLTNDNWDAARSTTLDNWDSQIPNETRKTGYIMTGNILQAIADTQDDKGGFPGQLVTYTDIDGNLHDGILMPDKWNVSMLRTSGVPIISRLQYIKDLNSIKSLDGKVEITANRYTGDYNIVVPKTKKDGAIFFENEELSRAVMRGNFYPFHGKLRADIEGRNIEKVIKILSSLGVKVEEERQGNDDVMFRDGDVVSEKRGRYSGKDAKQGPVQLSLFDTTEENGEQVAESEQKANAAIEAFAEVYDRYVEEEDDIITGNSENETNSVEAEMMQAQDEFMSALTDFYKQNGNLEEDATRMAKDMLAQVRSEVEFNRIYQRNATANGERKIEQQSATKETEQKPQQAEQEHSCVTAGGEVIEVKSTGGLRKLKEGEFANVERQFAVDKNFVFDGKAKIESVDDVAYVFRQLESYCVEHAFAMLVKDGNPTIIHLGMGTFTNTLVNKGALRAAVDEFGADEVYFIHNHPSGNLKPSGQDRALFASLQKMFEGSDIEVGAVIIDTTSGKYAIFDEDFDGKYDIPIPKDVNGTKQLPVQAFSRQVFNGEQQPVRQIKSSEDVAKAISTLRLGNQSKLGYMLLNRALQVVGNIYSNFDSYANATDIANEIVKYALHYGAEAIVTYGNVELKGINSVEAEVSRISGQSVQLLDAINIENGLSAKDSGIMEDAAPYEKTNTTIDDGTLFESDDTMYRVRTDEPPTKTGTGYKVFVLKNGKLYPPMVANPGGDATPVGIWLDADAAPIAGQSKTGRDQVKAGGKGTQGGSGSLAYRPGWHLGEIPYALQFNRKDENGEKTLFPGNFVWAEVEYADDVDYQEEAMKYGYTEKGKFRHSYAGLPKLPINGAYRYRTNPNPETDPWIITGAMRVKRVLTPSEVDKMVREAGRKPQQREANAITDADIDALNKEIETNSSTSQEVMAERVRELAEKLNLGNVDVVTDASTLEGKKASAKGFYSKSTGRITIVIPNNANVADVEQTLLHEAVAHYGLRQLFGEHFDTFLDNVFNNASEEVRRKIVALAAKNGWDFRKATEEYLASLAESTEFDKMDKGFWRQVKNFFLEMLDKIGFKGFSGVTLTDNELRYILWRSYENLTEPGGNRTIFGEAADVAKQYELQVGEYAPENANDDTLFRDGDPVQRERALARSVYDARVKSRMYQTIEAMQDSMLGLKEAMKAIAGEKYVEDIDGFENAYIGENRLAATNKAEADAFARILIKPMFEEVAKLAGNDAEYKALTEYMMAKHGLERNAYMRNEALQNGDSTANDRDFAGLTALMGESDVHAAELAAQQLVADYEQAHDTTALWEKVNGVSKALLRKSYECGMMDKETYEKVRDMYEYYIPLRGFDETTSEDVYSYLSSNNRIGAPLLKTAKGRKSKADDPIANLCLMADSTIMQGNRNKLVKQRFLNFVLNHPSDLVSVSELWLQYDDVNDEWIPVFPDNIEADDSPEVVEQKMQDFETKMQGLANQNPKRYKRSRDAKGIPYRIVEKRDAREHIVIVKRNGRDYVLTINGNPRAAQAINGLTNPDNDAGSFLGPILKGGEWVNRRLSALYTTYNPDFVASNFMRDLIFTNFSVWVKEGMNYALRYHKNYARVNPVTLLRLIKKYNSGKLDMSNKLEAQFYEFMMNGGETGFANIRDIEDQKSAIREELKGAHGKMKIKKALMLLKEQLDDLNRAAENCARFAAFITSREMGRSLDRSIYDAKEISVNFNKKGSGAKFVGKTGQTIAGNVAGTVSGAGRAGYVFWNAGIQGLTNFGRQAKRHPARAFAASATLFLLGAAVAYLGRGDDDDDDKEKKDKTGYYDLPESVRRTNILFKAGDSWIAIPLPIEYRAIYGMGELMMSVIGGKEHLTDAELAHAIAGQVTQVLPIDFLEGGGANAFIPSALKPFTEAYIMNKSWTGLPIYKDTPFNKEMPEWTKAYPRDNKYLVNLAAVINEATGGDKYTKGGVDINPSKLGYMLNGCFGGISSTIDRMSKLAATATGSMEYDPSSLPVLNRFIKAGDERTEYRAVNREYARLKEEHDVIAGRLRGYMKDTKSGVFDYAEKIDFINNSPEYARYMLFEVYKPTIDRLYEKRKTITDDAQIKELDRQINEVKRILIEEVEATRNRE